MSRHHDKQPIANISAHQDENTQSEGEEIKKDTTVKRDLSTFFIVILILIGGLAGLWWYDQKTQILSNWSKTISLPVDKGEEASLDQPQIQIENVEE